MKKIRLLSAVLALVAAPSCAFAGNILSIGIGAAPNDGTGDPLRTAMTKTMAAVNGLGNCFSGTLPPSSLMTLQCWWDTSAAPATLRYLDGTQWVAAGTLNQTTHVFSPQGGMTVGGDLTGTLPNPVVAPGAITSSKMAVGAAATNVGSLSGDLSGTLPGSVVIGANKVTFAKMAQVPAQTIACNPSGATNNMSACSVSASISLSGTTLNTAAMTGDVTSAAGSFGTTVAKIAGVAVTTPTGTGAVVLGTAPTVVSPSVSGGTFSGPTITTPTVTGGAFNGSPSIATPVIAGITSGAAAAAGKIGEVVSVSVASGSAVALVNGVSKDITTMTITAGYWLCSGAVGYSPSGSVTTFASSASIGTVANTGATADSGAPYGGLSSSSAASSSSTGLGAGLFNVSATTTLHLVTGSAFSGGGISAYGQMSCFRMH